VQLNFMDYDPAYEQQGILTPAKKDRVLPMSYAHEASEPAEELDTEKAPSAFKTISETAALLDVPQHVLRFWESRFTQIKPLKLRGGRRYYRPEDIEILTTVKNLLYKQGYTIEGAKKAFLGKKEDAPAKAARPAITDKQQSQLSVIRQELMGLKEVLKPYLF
jgi:DNA-binding transcriptional MerR regulator